MKNFRMAKKRSQDLLSHPTMSFFSLSEELVEREKMGRRMELEEDKRLKV